MNIIESIFDSNLFKPMFRDLGTWSAWIAALKAIFALPMSKEELALYESCTGRGPSQKPFKEVYLICGRRSGKSFVSALVATFLACFKSYSEFLSPGERAEVLVIAADRTQCQIIFRYVKSFLGSNSMLARMVETEKAELVDLNNRVSIRIVTCSYKAVRGYTAAAILCDELAFWRSDDGRNPASEVLRALRPCMITIPGALLLGISSPYNESGPLWDVFNRHYGRDDSDVFCWRAETRIMNPTVDQAVIDRDMLTDPEAAKAEWLAQFRTDLQDYLSEEAINAVRIQGRFELPPMQKVNYKAFVDPSGGRKDAAGLAIAHAEEDSRVILDLARRWPAPHDPGKVIKEQAEILKIYRLTRISGDRYAGSWPESEFLKFGITYEAAGKDKSQIYLDFLPLVLSGRVELLDNKHLAAELRVLERRTRKGGRDLVDHPPKGHDDLANAVAGVCILANVEERKPGLFFAGGGNKVIESKKEFPVFRDQNSKMDKWLRGD